MIDPTKFGGRKTALILKKTAIVAVIAAKKAAIAPVVVTGAAVLGAGYLVKKGVESMKKK